MPASETVQHIEWRKELATPLPMPSNATLSTPDISGSTLYLFMDESGNFDFSETGTKYFIMTCLVTKRPFSACHDLMDERYNTFEGGIRMKKFHAVTDKDGVKSRVYDIIARHHERLSAYAIYVDKTTLPEDLKTPDKLYAAVFEWLIEEIFRNEIDDQVSNVIAITDELPQDARRRQVAKPLKRLLADHSKKVNVTAYLEHFPSESEYNLQIADYLCWAFMRKEALDRSWPWEKIACVFSETGAMKI